ncbi:replication initiator protein [Peromfec virus RodF8_37]|uniref:Replication initiator protein n=1 Tax=Peromfec virus RodF8_37 TaxID=2929372 RepID=A0A976N2G6_9VIRU|nr:replication initiator protein [Peromfec virus RodF8_37]
MAACLNPYFGRVPNYQGSLPFPCGQCPICRSQKSAEWKLRCELEALCHSTFAFITLTYCDKYLPFDRQLVPSHLSDFLKRLRKRLPYKIRYFACGEYGGKRGRPHYHLIIFSLQPSDYPLVYECWHFADLSRYSRGIDVQQGNYESLGYVAGYVAEKQSQGYYLDNNITPPFHRASQGLGLKGYIMKLSGIFSSYILDSKNRVRYVGRYLRNKVADAFNIFEPIKQIGIEDLALKWQTIYQHFLDNEEHAILTMRCPPGVLINKQYVAWRYYYKGSISDFFSKRRLLKQRLDL